MGTVPSRLGAIGIDCADPETLGNFWQQALGYERKRAGEGYVDLIDPDGLPIEVFVQRVPEPKITKNRVHIDLYAQDEEAEADRLVTLGAKRLGKFTESCTWIVMTDPEGNEFCVCRRD